MDLKATVLIDNIAEPPLLCEWGLSICIEYRGRKILLDTGKSGILQKTQHSSVCSLLI